MQATYGNLRHHRALDFTDAHGDRVQSFQLLSPDSRAVATADFNGSELVRFACAPSVTADSDRWLADILNTGLVKRSREMHVLRAVLQEAALPVRRAENYAGGEFLEVATKANPDGVVIELRGGMIKWVACYSADLERLGNAFFGGEEKDGEDTSIDEHFDVFTVLRLVGEARRTLGLQDGDDTPFPRTAWRFEVATEDTELDFEEWREQRIDSAINDKFTALAAE